MANSAVFCTFGYSSCFLHSFFLVMSVNIRMRKSVIGTVIGEEAVKYSRQTPVAAILEENPSGIRDEGRSIAEKRLRKAVDASARLGDGNDSQLEIGTGAHRKYSPSLPVGRPQNKLPRAERGKRTNPIEPIRQCRPTCVRLNDLQRETIAQEIERLCPSVGEIYRKAWGVYLPIPSEYACDNMSTRQLDGAPINRTHALPLELEKYLNETLFSEDIVYLTEVRGRVSTIMAGLYWYDIEIRQLERRLEALECTYVLPVCEKQCGHLPVEVIRPCEWLCADAKNALLPFGEKMLELSGKSFQQLTNNSLFQHITAIATSCTSKLPCMTCNNESCSSFVQYIDIDQAANLICKSENPFLERMAPREEELPSLCYNKTNPCRGTLVSTPSHPEHWLKEVQDYATGSTALLHLLLNISSTALPMNGQAFPCSLACGGVLFSESQKNNVQEVMVLTLSITVVVCTLALLSFCIQWQRMKVYPTIILFYLNSSSLFAAVGFLSSYFAAKGDPDLILCHSDKSLRTTAPSGSGSDACVFFFSLCYFFFCATALWWSCLAHSWLMVIHSLGKERLRLSLLDQARYMKIYHATVWLCALILTVIATATKSISASPIYSICWLRTGLAHQNLQVIPVTVIVGLGCIFLGGGTFRLIFFWDHLKKVWVGGSAVSCPDQRKHIQNMTLWYTVRMLAYILIALILTLVQVITSVVQNNETEKWQTEVVKYGRCILSTCEDDELRTATQCPAIPRLSNTELYNARIVAFAVFGMWTALWTLVSPHAWKDLRRLPSRVCSSARRRISSLASNSMGNTTHMQTISVSSPRQAASQLRDAEGKEIEPS